MQLRRLKLVNFRQHAETELSLGAGLTAIVGPNGVGKSTLLEAVSWALYGNVAARGARDTIRRLSAPARAPVRVEVDFTLGAHEYRVVRSLYGAELYQDGADTPIANSHHAVTGKTARMLGMTHDEFFSTYFTGQKELTVMAAMGPTDRGKFLSKLLGYEKLRYAQQRLRQRRSQLRAEVQGLEQGLEDVEALEAERKEAVARVDAVAKASRELKHDRKRADESLAAARPKWEEMRTLRESTLSLDGERRIAEQVVQEARREFDRLDRELADAVDARNQLDAIAEDVARAEAVRGELEHLDREAHAADRRRVLSGQLSEVREQAGRLAAQLERAEVATDSLARATTAAQEARRTLDGLREREERLRTTWVRDRQDAETKRGQLLEQFNDLRTHRDRIVEAGPEGQCPTCARPLGSEFEAVLETLTMQLEEIKANGKYYKARVVQLDREPTDLHTVEEERSATLAAHDRAVRDAAAAEAQVKQRAEAEGELKRTGERVAALERELADLPDHYDAERHDAVRAEMKRLTPLVERATQLRVRAQHAERLVEEAERAERTLSEREDVVRQLTEALTASGFTEERYQEARQAFERADAHVRNVEVRAAQLDGDARVAQSALDAVERRTRERETRVAKRDALRRDVDIHDELDAAFEEMRTELNAKLRPDLAELGSVFAAQLTDGRYTEFELDDSYQIRVIDEGIPKPVISGGEEDVFNLALRLAISQMVAERAGQPLSLLVLDEIFGGLDDRRRQGVIDLLRRLGDRFPQVILITHIESVKEGADQVIRVSLDERAQAALVRDEPLTVTYEYATP